MHKTCIELQGLQNKECQRSLNFKEFIKKKLNSKLSER